MRKNLAAMLSLLSCLPALAMDHSARNCGNAQLKGRYVFTALGFQRAPDSPPGTPWIPKAILQVMQFSGDGRVTTPVLTIANPPIPPVDAGAIVSPPGGGTLGEYLIEDDCTGIVQFFDAGNVTFRVVVDRPKGDVWMIQTNPPNNVFQGTAKRLD